MEYVFNCYVVRVESQPAYDPPRYSVQVLLDGVVVTEVPVAQGAASGQVLTIILNLLSNLPPCP